jgi:recombinational DNA repair ATPase RecF
MPSTPNHGRWLKIAEIELAALARQCLQRRIGTPEQMRQEIAAWQQERNQAQVTIHWRFTTTDTRIKLKKHYPSLRCDIPLVARKIAREYIYAYAAVVPEKGEMVSLILPFITVPLHPLMLSLIPFVKNWYNLKGFQIFCAL